MLRNTVIAEMFSRLMSRLHPLDQKYNSRNFVFSLLVILLLSSSFIFLGITNINKNTDPEGADTTAYLGEANLIKNNGGVKNFLNLCITGKYKQANQHPLYILILSTFASRDISFFVKAKITSFMIGLILLLLFFVIARKKFGDICATIAALGLLCNPVFLRWTTMVASESLLMIFSLLSMYFVLKGFENAKYWTYAGACAGLAYLTKGQGLFLIPGFVVSSLITYRLKIFKNKYFWSFFLLFILVASPLIVRNIVVYQNPIYNINLKKNPPNVIGYQIFNPDKGAGIPVFYTIDSSESKINPSRSDFFDLHSFLRKAMAGVVKQTKNFIKLLNIRPVSILLTWQGRFLFSLLLLSLFILGITREKNSGGRVYVLTTLLTFVICLSFFRSYPRYFLPIIPFIWIYIALGMLAFLDFVRNRCLSDVSESNMALYTTRLLTVACILMLGYVLSTKAISNPVRSVDYSDDRLDLLKWMRANLNENDTYIEGPNFNWQLEKGTYVLAPYKNSGDFEKFNSFIQKQNITYVILDWYALTVNRYKTHMFVDKRKKFEGYFEFDPEKGIVQMKNVDRWQLIYKGSREKVEFMVFSAWPKT